MLEQNLKANYCWISNPPTQRLTHVYFRREVSLDTVPEQAEIHLFANTIYQLFVNGTFIGTGPARSYPEFPEYDTYQLQEYLKTGINVIAVNVAHHGMSTFHHLVAPGGFTAAGNIGNISLDTPGEWQCRESQGYNTSPHRFSFAIGPVQAFDARRENGDWQMGGTPSGAWEAPEKVTKKEPFNFAPRSIPHLTNNELLPAKLLSANLHDHSEDFYSLSIFAKFDPTVPQPASQRSFIYSYIHSPKAKTVDFGCWWGEYFLNGKRINVDNDSTMSFRQKGTMNLDEGWNFFLFSVGTVKDFCNLQMAIPSFAELIFSPDKEQENTVAFRFTEPIPEEQAQAILFQLPGKQLDEITELKKLWRNYLPPAIPEANIRFLSWIRFGSPLNLSENRLENIEIPAGEDCTLIFDMGQLNLGRIFVEYDAPPGSNIDVGYAEKMFDGRPHYNRNHLVYSAERQICNGPGRMETFAPRGLRYLQVTITGHDKAVYINKVGMMSQVYPYTQKCEFTCSDENFNKLYEWGWHTLKLCSEDVITDCPWRERTLYGGDLLPEAASAAVMSGDLRLVKRSIEIFLQSQNKKTGWLQSMAPMNRDRAPLFDYPPLVLLNAEWYCRLSGDAAFAERCYPVFKKMLDHALSIQDDSGLFPATHPVFIEHHYPFKEGVVTAFNALMSRTFSAWASMLKMLHKTDEAEQSLTISKDISQRISQYLWDENAGAFVDGIGPDGLSETHGISANAWPELFAEIDKEKWDKALSQMQKIMDNFNPYEEHKSISTYGAFYFLGALYKAGNAQFAEECIHTIYAEHFKNPTGTIWEHANPEKSLVHAWSTAPSYYFATRVLGVQLGFPEKTDLTKITIAPEAESLTWAKGTVLHPLGEVTIDWKIEGEKLILNYQAPEDVKVVVAPKGKLAGLELVEKEIKSQTTQVLS